MGWGSLGFDSVQGQEIFLFLKTFRLSLGPTQTPVQLVPGTFSPGAKWLGHDNHSHPPIPTSAKVKKEWRNTSILAICLHGMFD
jgi:hypothetical protein